MAYSSGKYFPETRLGNTFIGSTAAAGTAYPITTGTAGTFGLWNTSSNKLAVLHKLTVGFTSGTIALGTVGLIHVQATTVAAEGAPSAPGTQVAWPPVDSPGTIQA